jgi:hypothetical protein
VTPTPDVTDVTTYPQIEIRDLTQRFRLTRVLHGIDLALGPGVFGLLGPNGAGYAGLALLGGWPAGSPGAWVVPLAYGVLAWLAPSAASNAPPMWAWTWYPVADHAATLGAVDLCLAGLAPASDAALEERHGLLPPSRFPHYPDDLPARRRGGASRLRRAYGQPTVARRTLLARTAPGELLAGAEPAEEAMAGAMAAGHRGAGAPARRAAYPCVEWLRNGFPPLFDQRESIYRIAFADGYERCLWVRGRGSNGLLDLVNGGYVDCATMPAPSGRPGTPPTP